MAISKASSYEAVLAEVSSWPSGERLNLLQDILKTLAPTVQEVRPARKTVEKAYGMLKTGQPAPSDQETQEWLEERRSGADFNQ